MTTDANANDTVASGAADTVAGGADTLAGGNDTLAGGEDTTQGGNDTTAGGEDTTQGGNDTLEGGDDKNKKPEEPAKPKAPEKYELKLAENVKLTPEVQAKIEAFARANDMSQETAQALVDLGPDLSKMFESNLHASIKDVSAKWMGETKIDKEIAGGGDKTVLAANMALVAKARDAFATPELMTLLNDFDPVKNKGGTGFGNHPEVVRLFLRLGKAISEDNTLVDGKEAVAPQSAASKLYGKTTKPK